MISLGAVNVTDRARRLMTMALDVGRIGQGWLIRDFESELAEWFGVEHAIVVASGTVADSVALAAVIRPELGPVDQEVILPALTFVAQANAIYYNQLTPRFVDVTHDMVIDVGKVEDAICSSTVAIMPTHLLGRPADMDAIRQLGETHNLPVIEDACEALGSRYKGDLVGTLGDMGCFSFFVSHSLTTGEGGVIVTNDAGLAEKARSLRNHGRLSNKPTESFTFPRIGFSGKMNEMEAAIGLGVMPELDEIIRARRLNMVVLNRLLGGRFKNRPQESIVPHGYPIMFPGREARDEAILALHRGGVECRPLFASIPTQVPAYAFLGLQLGTYPVAERFGDCGLYVPCHQNLRDAEVQRIAKLVKEVL